MTLGGHVTEGKRTWVLRASGGRQSLQGLGDGRGTQGARREKSIPEWGPCVGAGETNWGAGGKGGCQAQVASERQEGLGESASQQT